MPQVIVLLSAHLLPSFPHSHVTGSHVILEFEFLSVLDLFQFARLTPVEHRTHTAIFAHCFSRLNSVESPLAQ